MSRGSGGGESLRIDPVVGKGAMFPAEQVGPWSEEGDQEVAQGFAYLELNSDSSRGKKSRGGTGPHGSKSGQAQDSTTLLDSVTQPLADAAGFFYDSTLGGPAPEVETDDKKQRSSSMSSTSSTSSTRSSRSGAKARAFQQGDGAKQVTGVSF